MTKRLIYMIAYINGRSVGSLFNDEFYLGVNYTPRFGATFNAMSYETLLAFLGKPARHWDVCPMCWSSWLHGPAVSILILLEDMDDQE
ncbi:hypothetical protein niasHT_027482 [Heterodera trifolii]|uniref:Uncharacterized protein n=1 Tax=Heterodera trifolii TaxID=157864 RepID=A0ABD2JML2_9BILA